MRNHFLIIFGIFVLLSMPMGLVAQKGAGTQKVSAYFSRDTIMIGDQPTLTIKVTKDVADRVAFPEFDAKMTDEFELISQGDIDTTRTDGSRVMELVREYVVTVFDAGNYTIDGLGVVFYDETKADTLISNPLNIVVNTYVIDTTTQKIYDVKAPIETPLRFNEISKYVYWGALALLLIALAIYVIIRLRRKESFFSRPKLPPHVIAVGELKKIENMNLWQKGKHKEYYTMLTDTVRTYLEARFGTSAMEMTTDEIMNAINTDTITPSDRAMLYELLSTADLVKFAKFIPDNADNTAALATAYSFVEHTKVEEPSPEAEQEADTDTTNCDNEETENNEPTKGKEEDK